MRPTLKLWIFWDFPVKAKRGEMKGPRGCLRVSSQFAHANMGDCRNEVRRYVAIHREYGQLAKATVYNLADWERDCLTAQPVADLTTCGTGA